MEAVYLDTHVVVWLFSGEIQKLSDKAVKLIEESELLVSPMVVLELELLYEVGRLNYQHEEILSSLSESIDLKVRDISFASVAKEAVRVNWTRDPFDRLIVANAMHDHNSLLLTRDKKILNNYDRAVWQS